MQPQISCDKSIYVNNIFDELLQLFNGALKSNIVNQDLPNKVFSAHYFLQNLESQIILN